MSGIMWDYLLDTIYGMYLTRTKKQGDLRRLVHA